MGCLDNEDLRRSRLLRYGLPQERPSAIGVIDALLELLSALRSEMRKTDVPGFFPVIATLDRTMQELIWAEFDVADSF